MEGLRGILEVSWRRLGASWTCLGENVKKRSRAITFWKVWGAKMEPKIIKIRVKMLFLAFLNIFFVICHVFESQVVRTCSRRILAKH